MVDDVENRIIQVLKRHNVKKAALFGSYVRGEAKDGSDIDILVELDEDVSLLDFAGIKLELEEATGKKVDMVEYETIKPLLRDIILKEQGCAHLRRINFPLPRILVSIHENFL